MNAEATGELGIMKRIGIVLLLQVLSSGCVVVGGYSSERGWYLWPGTIVIFVVVAVLFLLLRRRS
jgi:hypothetical protein